MPHYKERNNPRACLFGNCLKGNRSKSFRPKNNRIRITSFSCEVEICPDKTCRRMANIQYGPYGFSLHGNAGDSMSGFHGIIEPACGYDGPGYSEDKSPKKGTLHNPAFKLNISDTCPAVCYFDSLETQTISAQVQLNKVQIKN